MQSYELIENKVRYHDETKVINDLLTGLLFYYKDANRFCKGCYAIIHPSITGGELNCSQVSYPVSDILILLHADKLIKLDVEFEHKNKVVHFEYDNYSFGPELIRLLANQNIENLSDIRKSVLNSDEVSEEDFDKYFSLSKMTMEEVNNFNNLKGAYLTVSVSNYLPCDDSALDDFFDDLISEGL